MQTQRRNLPASLHDQKPVNDNSDSKTQFQIKHLLGVIFVSSSFCAGLSLGGFAHAVILTFSLSLVTVFIFLTAESWKSMENDQRTLALIVTSVSAIGFVLVFGAMVTRSIW